MAELEAAETGRRQIVRRGDLQHAALRAEGGVNGMGVEAVVDRYVAGQSIEDALLSFDCDDTAPTGHALRPRHGMDTDVGATVYRDHTLAEMLAAQAKQ